MYSNIYLGFIYIISPVLFTFHQLGPTGPSWSRSRHVRGSVCVSVCVSVCAIKSQGSKGGPRGAKQSPIDPQIT